MWGADGTQSERSIDPHGRWLAAVVGKRAATAAATAAAPAGLHICPAPPTLTLPASAVAALAAVNPLADFLQGQADYFSTLNLPQGLVQWGEWRSRCTEGPAHACLAGFAACLCRRKPELHRLPPYLPDNPATRLLCCWLRASAAAATCPAPAALILLPPPPPPAGHPGNMAVVLLAMGMYGCGYLGWRIRLSDDAGEVATAQDLHPKVGRTSAPTGLWPLLHAQVAVREVLLWCPPLHPQATLASICLPSQPLPTRISS